MTAAVSSQQTVIAMGDGAGPEVFTPIPEVADFDGPGGEAAEIEVTSLDSTSKEFISGLRDNGDYSFNGNFLAGDVTQQALRDAVGGDAVNFRKTYPLAAGDSTPLIADFAAIVKSFRTTGSVDTQLKFSCSLRITGEISWTDPT